MDKQALKALFTDDAPFALVTMKTLRNIADEGKSLGVHVTTRIEEGLASCGFHHLPPRLPRSQDETVLLYRSSRVGMILDLCRLVCGDETLPLKAPQESMLQVIAMTGIQVERETARLTDEQREAASAISSDHIMAK